MFSMALRGRLLPKKIALPVVRKRGTLERSLTRRKLQMSKARIISFPDKVECALNFEKLSGLH